MLTRLARRWVPCCGLLVSLTAPSVVLAESSAAQCNARLADLDEARVVLEDLQRVVVDTRTERAGLMRRNKAIRAELVAPSLTEQRETELRNELARINDRLDAILGVLPPIEAQARALAEQVDAAERSYIQCIESFLE